MNYLREVLKAVIFGVKPPVGQKWNQWVHRSFGKTHCEECLILDGCWFSANNTPQWPHHFYCHCVLEDLSYYDVVTKSPAYCPNGKIRLITPYGGK